MIYIEKRDEGRIQLWGKVKTDRIKKELQF